MISLPKLVYQDTLVEPDNVPAQIWELYFSHYLIQPSRFYRDIDDQMRILQTVASDLTRTRTAEAVLRAIAPKVRTLRAWVALQKVKPVAALIAGELDIGVYDKIVVYGSTPEALGYLQESTLPYKPMKLFPGTPPQKRNMVLKKFRNDPERRLLIVSIPAADGGLDLAYLHNAIVIDAAWDARANEQAVRRLWKTGQEQRVLVRFVAVKDALDQYVQHMMKRYTRKLTLNNS